MSGKREGGFIWNRRDIKPDRREREFLNFVEQQYRAGRRGLEQFNLATDQQIITAPLLNALAEATKIK